MKNIIYKMIAVLLIFTVSCDDLEKYQLPEANSIPDETPPVASFSAIQGEGFEFEEWTLYQFTNGSTSATMYSWNFGDGNTSTDFEPTNMFPGEGTYTVSLTATDNLGVSSTSTQEVVVVEPEAPAVPDPVIVNGEFVKLPKSSGSDCACSGWINRDLGEQGESSTASGLDVVKFDNNEPDHIYQEFEVVPNADYLVETSIRHSTTDGTMPSSLEIRVLAGSGYEAGYTPVYYTDTAVMPQGNSSTGYWGYRSIAQVENADNNLKIQVLDNPGNDDYNNVVFSFNSGANDSVVLFMRGIGGDSSGNYGYNSGNEEIRSAYVIITAVEN
ncbi:PKD domain-containing protein [uncultured Winogradskyella sp.]|uniref:PKD domain-containing protein n=1 Tax=uncultured Winogradskyella sp. TaxID=395353 RepID=UPI002613D284|nr:PKD domain-containing protein [uncultured Winogradskyella sp.]